MTTEARATQFMGDSIQVAFTPHALCNLQITLGLRLRHLDRGERIATTMDEGSLESCDSLTFRYCACWSAVCPIPGVQMMPSSLLLEVWLFLQYPSPHATTAAQPFSPHVLARSASLTAIGETSAGSGSSSPLLSDVEYYRKPYGIAEVIWNMSTGKISASLHHASIYLIRSLP